MIKVISRTDEKPVPFDFGAGNMMVIRYIIETFDGLINLFVPYIHFILQRLVIGRFFKLGDRKCFDFKSNNSKTREWIVFVNRLKNITLIDLKLAERSHGSAIKKSVRPAVVRAA